MKCLNSEPEKTTTALSCNLWQNEAEISGRKRHQKTTAKFRNVSFGNGEGKTKLLDVRSTSCKIYQRMLAYLEVPWCDYVANNFIGNQRPIIQSFNSSFKLTD